MFEQIAGFSGFGFPKAHAAAFGLLAYQSTWLRVHYGPELLCSLLNEQPMGFYPPDALVHEAQRRGIEVRPPDVNAARSECRVEAHGELRHRPRATAVRIGLGYVNELAEDDAGVVERARRAGPTRARRPRLALGRGATALERLAWAGACDRWCAGRAGRRSRELGGRRSGRPAAWPRLRRERTAGRSSPCRSRRRRRPPLPELDPWERIVADYAVDRDDAGRPPDGADARRSSDGARPKRGPRADPRRARVEVAGMVVARQRPATAKGVVFMLLEDETGTINLVVPPPVYERYRLAVRTAAFVRVAGRLERREGAINVVVVDGRARSARPTCRWPRSARSSRPCRDGREPDPRRGPRPASERARSDGVAQAGGAKVAARSPHATPRAARFRSLRLPLQVPLQNMSVRTRS